MNKKICLVTGATGDIGQAILTQAYKEGYFLIAFGRDQIKLASIKNQYGNVVKCISLDLKDQDQMNALLAELHDSFKKIALIFNTAGTFVWDDEFSGATPEEKQINAVQSLYEINFASKIRFMSEFKRVFGEQYHPIVMNISSHVARNDIFPDAELKKWGEWGYGLSMRELSKFTRERMKDKDEAYLYMLSEPGLIDTQMARGKFTDERLGRHVDWENEAKKPEVFAKELFAEIKAHL